MQMTKKFFFMAILGVLVGSQLHGMDVITGLRDGLRNWFNPAPVVNRDVTIDHADEQRVAKAQDILAQIREVLPKPQIQRIIRDYLDYRQGVPLVPFVFAIDRAPLSAFISLEKVALAGDDTIMFEVACCKQHCNKKMAHTPVCRGNILMRYYKNSKTGLCAEGSTLPNMHVAPSELVEQAGSLTYDVDTQLGGRRVVAAIQPGHKAVVGAIEPVIHPDERFLVSLWYDNNNPLIDNSSSSTSSTSSTITSSNSCSTSCDA